MTHPTARGLRITGMHRRVTSPIYRLTQCLRDERSIEVPADEIAPTVSAWLTELGANSPLVEDLARAVRAGNWPAARALGEYLSIDVTVAA